MRHVHVEHDICRFYHAVAAIGISVQVQGRRFVGCGYMRLLAPAREAAHVSTAVTSERRGKERLFAKLFFFGIHACLMLEPGCGWFVLCIINTHHLPDFVYPRGISVLLRRHSFTKITNKAVRKASFTNAHLPSSVAVGLDVLHLC